MPKYLKRIFSDAEARRRHGEVIGEIRRKPFLLGVPSSSRIQTIQGTRLRCGSHTIEPDLIVVYGDTHCNEIILVEVKYGGGEDTLRKAYDQLCLMDEYVRNYPDNIVQQISKSGVQLHSSYHLSTMCAYRIGRRIERFTLDNLPLCLRNHILIRD